MHVSGHFPIRLVALIDWIYDSPDQRMKLTLLPLSRNLNRITKAFKVEDSSKPIKSLDLDQIQINLANKWQSRSWVVEEIRIVLRILQRVLLTSL